MPIASLQDYVDRAIFYAQANTKLGENPVISADIEAETLVANALHAFATKVAQDPERRHLLQKATSVVLANGVGTLDSTLLTQFIDDGSVRDDDTAINQGMGNVLVRVHQFNDFLAYLPTFLGYFCLHNDQIYTRAINSGSMVDTQNLTVECAYVPEVTEIPEEITDDAVAALAMMLLKQPIE